MYAIAEAIGCKVLPWRPRENAQGELYFDVAEALALMEEHDPKLTVVNFPHNPTGKTLARADWDALVSNCQARGRHLFSDEMYRLLEHDEATRLPSAVDCYEKAIVLCGVSKTMGLPGLGCGSAKRPPAFRFRALPLAVRVRVIVIVSVLVTC